MFARARQTGRNLGLCNPLSTARINRVIRVGEARVLVDFQSAIERHILEIYALDRNSFSLSRAPTQLCFIALLISRARPVNSLIYATFEISPRYFSLPGRVIYARERGVQSFSSPRWLQCTGIFFFSSRAARGYGMT